MDHEEDIEIQNYSHLDTLLNDVIQLQHTPSKLNIHNFELDSIPKNIAQSKRPPK